MTNEDRFKTAIVAISNNIYLKTFILHKAPVDNHPLFALFSCHWFWPGHAVPYRSQIHVRSVKSMVSSVIKVLVERRTCLNWNAGGWQPRQLCMNKNSTNPNGYVNVFNYDQSTYSRPNVAEETVTSRGFTKGKPRVKKNYLIPVARPSTFWPGNVGGVDWLVIHETRWNVYFTNTISSFTNPWSLRYSYYSSPVCMWIDHNTSISVPFEALVASSPTEAPP